MKSDLLGLSPHLQRLESEAIFIIREAYSALKRPVLLFSMGKDSCVLLHLAKLAFAPAPIPFPLLHVDTNWKFREMYDFRERISKNENLQFLIHKNPEAVEKNINPFDNPIEHTDIWKTVGLKQALLKYEFDGAFGGARRDEEKSRAKERIFSMRSSNNNWDPKNQRPEFWKLFNLFHNEGESFRIFPLSNWTERDVWLYIYLHKIEVPELYFAKPRETIVRNGQIFSIDDDRFRLEENETPQLRKVRFRTLGCYPLTAGIESDAEDIETIVKEVYFSKYSERQGRVIDFQNNSGMEKKKREGYF